MKDHKHAIYFFLGVLGLIALLVWLVYFKGATSTAKKSGESKYLDGYHYLTLKPDPYPNFPS